MENRVYTSDEFVLNIDWECEEKDVQDALYCLTMTKDRKLQSVRDLNGDHLEMLKRMRDESLAAIEKRYGLKKSLIRAFFHYPPTYWHLHVHFCHTNITAKVNCSAGRAILLDDVIDNIEAQPDYYQKRALTMTIKEGTALHEIL